VRLTHVRDVNNRYANLFGTKHLGKIQGLGIGLAVGSSGIGPVLFGLSCVRLGDERNSFCCAAQGVASSAGCRVCLTVAAVAAAGFPLVSSSALERARRQGQWRFMRIFGSPYTYFRKPSRRQLDSCSTAHAGTTTGIRSHRR
jgi:hypothetical protein